MAMSHYALETRWLDREGRKHLIVVHVQTDPLVMLWGCTFTQMFGDDADAFEANRTALLDSLKGFKLHPDLLKAQAQR